MLKILFLRCENVLIINNSAYSMTVAIMGYFVIA